MKSKELKKLWRITMDDSKVTDYNRIFDVFKLSDGRFIPSRHMKIKNKIRRARILRTKRRHRK